MDFREHIFFTGERQLCVYEAGDLQGTPVLVHNGTPSSRILNPVWVEDARAQGIRLIGYDRPGYGSSTSYVGRSVASVAEDVVTIAEALNLNRMAVWGHSGGGPHALATAALLPDLVFAAACISSLAPYDAEGLDWLDGMGAGNITEFGAALESKEALEAFLEAEAPGFLATDSEALIQALRSLLTPVDAAALHGEFATGLIRTITEGIRTRRDGWRDDDLAFLRPWGFRLAQINIPVLLLHGRQDLFVPHAHGEWLANHIPNVDARILPDDGHLSVIVDHISEIHSWLLQKKD